MTASIQKSSTEAGASDQRTFWVLVAAIFVVGVDSRVITPLLPAMAQEFNVSIGSAGWIVTAYLLPYGLLQLVYGPLADRVGQVRVISLTAAAFALACLLSGLAPGIQSLIAARLFTGVAAAAIFPLTLSYIGETLPYDRRPHAIGIIVTATAIGQVFSTAVGGFLATVLTWRAIFVLDGVVAAGIAVILIRRMMSSTPQPRQPSRVLASYQNVLADRRHLLFYGLILAEGAITIGAFAFFGAVLRERDGFSYAAIGVMTTMFGVGSIIAGRLIGRLASRLGERRMIAIGGTGITLTYLLATVQPAILFFPAAMLLAGATFILMHSTLQTRATELAPDARSTGITVFAFSLFVGSSIGAVVVAQAIDWVGYNTILVALAGAAVVLTLAATFGAIRWSLPYRAVLTEGTT